MIPSKMNSFLGEEIAGTSLGKMQTQREGRGKAMKEELDYIIHSG